MDPLGLYTSRAYAGLPDVMMWSDLQCVLEDMITYGPS